MGNFIGVDDDLKVVESFEEAAESILRMMSKFIHINTLFIAKNDKCTNEIVKVLNRENTLLEEGDSLPFEETFCKLSVDKGKQILIIPDINENDLTLSLNVTKNLGGGCFIGIPIYYKDGENYGTICGLDTKPFQFTESHLELFETMASLLTYVLELDSAHKQIENLSAPFVPITKGVAILPIIGIITEQRVENIIFLALKKSQQLSLEYLIIDLSGISQMNDLVSEALLKIGSLLKLIGVTPILTGIYPGIALKAVNSDVASQDIMIEANLERALNKIGFILEKSKEKDKETKS
ncbi:GAF domain-containing protein [Pseudobacillus wudalianchiensis]|uniref:Histidine kinase n=1 Tax=Pseudobacillus wudalianchiensis TaxID=1743143 RepID=A0A1B9AN04_9BACI|nr:GAF domain-containing protein [Bacillus wudalianchiensis]OCA85212.1 histidine kinase [Bacillus wudalianchiensis]